MASVTLFFPNQPGGRTLNQFLRNMA